jgi:hypothetical protein
MIVRRVGALSLAKVLAVVYVIVGFGIGFFVSCMALLGISGEDTREIGGLFGVGAIIFLPIFYSLIGFLSGLVTGAIYNWAVRWVGGIEVQLDNVQEPSASPSI